MSETRAAGPVARALGWILFGVGLSLLAGAVFGLWRDVRWIAQPFYAYAWWGLIFALDGACVLLQGDSLLTTRRRFVLPMALWSVTFWFFFELLNLRFQNWYYVGVFAILDVKELVFGGVFVVACFSTVFVGMFEMIDLLGAIGLFLRLRGRPAKFPVWVSYALQILGATMAALALLKPYYLAPLIWGSLTFLVDPWNYRLGARSILRDLEARDFGLVARVFTAGLLCGVVWESLNFFAPQKWIYTVRGLENLKLFEMPLLGFLGFPGLAFDALAVFALLSYWFLGNETWERAGSPVYLLPPRPTVGRRWFWGTAAVQPLFWAVTTYSMIFVNFGSVELSLDDLDLSVGQTRILFERGIDRPRQLLRAARDVDRRRELQRELGEVGVEWERLLDQAELFVFKGIGARFGRMLEEVGVGKVADLAVWDPEELHHRLLSAGLNHDGRPRLDMVRVWVLAAR